MKSRAQERLIVFNLGEELYGVEITQVKEVISYRNVRELPEAPGFVQGVIWSRNRRIPVLDLKRRFGVRGGAEGANIVMILDTVPPLGVAIDRISRILNLESRHYEPLPEEAIGKRGENRVEWVIKMEEELILIITPEQILTPTEKDALKNLKEGKKNE
ncbi:MAG: chemotaxis protein CheW [bacterium]|nr:chemotaxis protein CheW [bacterium]